MKNYFVIIFSLLLLTIVGCSSNEQNSSSNSNESNNGNSLEGTKITHLAMSGSGRPEAYNELAKEFEEKTGIEVEIVEAAYQQLHDKIVTDVASQTGAYDVVDVDVGWDGKLAPHWEPLQPYIDSNDMDLSDMLPIYQEAVGVSSITNGERYGMPITGTSMANFYRKDLLEEWDLEVPKTWDEMISILPEIEEKGYTPFTSAGVGVQLNKLFYAAYIPEGKPLFTEDFEPLFNGSEGMEAMKRLKSTFEYAPDGFLAMDNPDANQPFINGEAVLQLAWPLFILNDLDDSNKSSIVDNWGVEVPPGPSNIAPWYLAIPKASQNKDAAFEWVKFVTSKESTKTLMLEYGNYSVWNSVWEDPEIEDNIPGALKIRDAINSSFLPTFFMHPAFAAWFNNTGDTISSFLAEEIDAQEALDIIEKDWNELHENNPPEESLIYEELGIQ